VSAGLDAEPGRAVRAWDELARQAASREADGAEAARLRELLRFELSGDAYAIAVDRVREIVRLRVITPIPRAEQEVLGVISLRGEIVEVVDLRRRLGLEAGPPERRSRIIVVRAADGGVAGLLVDAVREVVRVPEEALRAASGETEAVEALCERGGAFVSILDLERVLSLGTRSAA
jgi:purine-binding chemotaxis protein CheW